MNSRININPFQVFKKEWTLLGSIINPFTFQAALDFLQSIEIPLENLGVRLYPLEAYSRVIEEVRRGEITKAMFRMNT